MSEPQQETSSEASSHPSAASPAPLIVNDSATHTHREMPLTAGPGQSQPDAPSIKEGVEDHSRKIASLSNPLQPADAKIHLATAISESCIVKPEREHRCSSPYCYHRKRQPEQEDVFRLKREYEACQNDPVKTDLGQNPSKKIKLQNATVSQAVSSHLSRHQIIPEPSLSHHQSPSVALPSMYFLLGQYFENPSGSRWPTPLIPPQHRHHLRRNLDVSFCFYYFAAMMGHVDAQISLGYCYRYGVGTSKNEHKAVKWWTVALERLKIRMDYANANGVSSDSALQVAQELDDEEDNSDAAVIAKSVMFPVPGHHEWKLEGTVIGTLGTRKIVKKTIKLYHRVADVSLPHIPKVKSPVHLEDASLLISLLLSTPETLAFSSVMKPELETFNNVLVPHTLLPNPIGKARLASVVTELGICYHLGLGTLSAFASKGGAVPRPSENDIASAVQMYIYATSLGNPTAACNLGYCSRYGTGGVPLSEKTSIQLYAYSAHKGHPAGLFNLANSFRYGIGGIPMNIAKAEILYRSSGVKRGFVKALVSLGEILTYPDVSVRCAGVPLTGTLGKRKRDYGEEHASLKSLVVIQNRTRIEELTEAVSVWRMAAEKGSRDAMFHLGALYHSGIYVTDNTEPFERSVVSQPLPKVVTVLERDLQMARSFYQQASEKGCDLATVYLAYCIQENQGHIDVSLAESSTDSVNDGETFSETTQDDNHVHIERREGDMTTEQPKFAEEQRERIDEQQTDFQAACALENEADPELDESYRKEVAYELINTTFEASRNCSSSSEGPMAPIGARIYLMASERRHEAALHIVHVSYVWLSYALMLVPHYQSSRK